MTEYKKGTVVLVFFPNSELIAAKHRPAVIVQADQLNTGLEQIIAAMVTSNLSVRDIQAVSVLIKIQTAEDKKGNGYNYSLHLKASSF